MGRRRLSGASLARALNVSPAWVSYRLTGIQEIGVNELERIAAVLDVDVTDLLPREGKLIAVGAASRPSRSEFKPWTIGLTQRPGPKGPRSRNTAEPQTRRTGRIRQALAAA